MKNRKTLLDEIIEKVWLLVIYGFALLALAAIMSTLSGCASAGVAANPSTQPRYELTLQGQLDGVPFQGIAIGSVARTHTITISSSYDVNYFVAKTCHRSEKREDVITQGWFPNTKSWSYTFSESPTIEDTGDCPLRLCVYSKTVGAPAVQCAVIDFKNTKYLMQAENICNGSDGNSYGKNMCHTQVGLIQRVRFGEPVVVAPPMKPPEGSPDMTPYLIKDECKGSFIDDQNTLWQYVMPSGECYVVFMQKAQPHMRAKLTVIPYDLPQYSGGK